MANGEDPCIVCCWHPLPHCAKDRHRPEFCCYCKKHRKTDVLELYRSHRSDHGPFYMSELEAAYKK